MSSGGGGCGGRDVEATGGENDVEDADPCPMQPAEVGLVTILIGGRPGGATYTRREGGGRDVAGEMERARTDAGIPRCTEEGDDSRWQPTQWVRSYNSSILLGTGPKWCFTKSGGGRGMQSAGINCWGDSTLLLSSWPHPQSRQPPTTQNSKKAHLTATKHL